MMDSIDAKYDLHSHSYFSDGELSPQSLIALAKEQGVTHLALTDHDTLTGLNAARLASNSTGMTLINGVELSCTWQNQLLHIVGLNINLDDECLQKGIEINTQSRLSRAEVMHDDFLSVNIDLRDEVNQQLNGRGVPTRPHFAQALVKQGYAKDKKQAFKRYLVRGKTGFIPMQWPELNEVASWITSAGGVAVLAHPMRYKFTRTKLIRLIEDMKEAGIQGIEVSTPTTDRQQGAMLANLAIEHELLASIGSDFHSLDQPWARLGSAWPLSKELTPVWAEFSHIN